MSEDNVDNLPTPIEDILLIVELTLSWTQAEDILLIFWSVDDVWCGGAQALCQLRHIF